MTKKERMFTLARRLWLVVQMLPEQTFQDCKKWLDEIETLLNEEMEEESIPVKWIEEEYSKKCGGLPLSIDHMIADWRKENESSIDN